MKKIFLTAVFCLFIVASNAYASIISFDSAGWVNPNYNDTWDPSTLTGTARYYFDFTDPNVKPFWLSLQFEGDVFDLAALNSSKVDMVNPEYWLDGVTGNSSFKYIQATGFPVGSGLSPIIMDVDYKLLGDPNTLNWDEGQAWGQSYAMLGAGTGSNFGDLGVSGGSTAPVPEPGTMMLLSMGVLGLFGLRRKS